MRLTDLPLTLGETVEIDGELWRALRARRPSPDSDAAIHYILVPLLAEPRSLGGDAA